MKDIAFIGSFILFVVCSIIIVSYPKDYICDGKEYKSVVSDKPNQISYYDKDGSYVYILCKELIKNKIMFFTLLIQIF